MLLQAIRIQRQSPSAFLVFPATPGSCGARELRCIVSRRFQLASIFGGSKETNRRQRRAEMARARKLKPDRAMAIHEAGHALARVLTADLMGIKPEEAVEAIEIRPTRVRAGEGEAYEASITIITSG